MTENILQKIINNRIKEIEKQKTLLSSEKLQDQISQNEIEDMWGIKYYDFKKKISDNIKNGKKEIPNLTRLPLGLISRVHLGILVLTRVQQPSPIYLVKVGFGTYPSKVIS